jgi:ABC-type polysaccharide/polyol phosphate export permease
MGGAIPLLRLYSFTGKTWPFLNVFLMHSAMLFVFGATAPSGSGPPHSRGF